MSYAVPLRPALSPSATTRQSGLFPVGRPGWMEARPSPTGKATQHVAVVSTPYVRVQSDRARAIRRDIDSEFRVKEINYTIIDSDYSRNFLIDYIRGFTENYVFFFFF